MSKDKQEVYVLNLINALDGLFGAVIHDKGETEMLTSLGKTEKLLFEAGRVTRRYYEHHWPIQPTFSVGDDGEPMI